MKRTIIALLIVLGLARLGCSIPDPGDRQELEDKIAALPPDTQSGLRAWASRQLVIRWLSKFDRNRKVGTVECREIGPGADPAHVDWFDHEDITVGHVLTCLVVFAFSYTVCMDETARNVAKGYNMAAAMDDVANVRLECRVKIATEFEPDKVAAEARGKNKVNPGDMHRLAELLTVSEITDAVLNSDLPPPLPGGVLAGSAFADILPLLCALDASGGHWGCPDSPLYPGPDKPGGN